jgi:hypothetical protein
VLLEEAVYLVCPDKGMVNNTLLGRDCIDLLGIEHIVEEEEQEEPGKENSKQCLVSHIIFLAKSFIC